MSPRLVLRPEPVEHLTAHCDDGSQFDFDATFRESWAKAEALAAGVRVNRIMLRSRDPRRSHVSTRGADE